MPDVSAYPMLATRAKRRRRLSRPSNRVVRLAAVFGVALLLIGGFVWASRPGPPDPRAKLAAARASFAAGNYNAARSNAEQALSVDPKLAAGQIVLARALLELGQGLPAEAALGRAGQVGAAMHALLAHAKLLQGDATGALTEVARAGSRDSEAVRVQALALATTGQAAAAQRALAALVARSPGDARAWTALGRLRLGAGEMGGAAVAAATAARLSPGEPGALTLQGEVVRARYGLVAALPWFEAALARDAYYYPALIQYAATLGDAGRAAEALAATRQALRARPTDPPALYLQAVIAARAGKVELARRLLAAAGDAPGAQMLGGALDLASGRNEEAAASLKELVARQPMNVTARRLLAAALLRSGDARGSLDAIRPVALRGDADSYALALAGRAWEAAGQHGPAATMLDRAASGARAPAGPFATDERMAALTGGAAASPGDPTYVLGVIRGLWSGGDRAGALVRARALAAAAPGDPPALLALGDVLAASGQWGPAAGVYIRAANLLFDEPTALRLVDALGRAGKRADAAAALALYLGQNPQSLTGRRLLGHWQVASGDWDAGIGTLESVRAQVGDRDAGLLADLSLAYAGAGEGAVARRYGRAAYALVPMNAGACDAYGVALAADGEVAGARQLFDKAHMLAPREPAYMAHRRQLS